MPLSLSVFSQSGPPICTPIWAFFRAFKALRALKGPLIKFSHILMHRPYRDILYLKFSCLYLFPFSHKVVPQKASGGGGGVGGVVYHTSTGQYIGVATFFFFFFFFESGLKLDEKSIENGLEGQKCSVGGLFWGWLSPLVTTPSQNVKWTVLQANGNVTQTVPVLTRLRDVTELGIVRRTLLNRKFLMNTTVLLIVSSYW